MLRLLSGILLLLLLVTPLATLGVFAPVAAQPSGTVVYIRTVAPDGAAITDACYTFVNASLEGCAENRDGYIRFEGIPAGSYTVQQTRGVAGYLPVGDFPVTLEPSTSEQYVDVLMAPATIGAGTIVDIAIRAVDPANGTSAAGGCMILHGSSNEGCDEDRDGQIRLQGVAVGTYLLEETSTPDGAYTLGSQWVIVDRDGEIVVMRPMSEVHPSAGTADVSLATRDPNTGNLLPGACYIILDASNEGCDENGDGLVDFDDVVVGTFTVRQTIAPQDYQPVNDFDINIAPLDPEQSILVKQAPEQHDATHRHVSVVLYDSDTGLPVRSGSCLVIVGASQEGCDDNRDGQIDFLDVAVGTHPIEFTRLPAGYSPAHATNSVFNDSDNPFSVTVVYIGLSADR